MNFSEPSAAILQMTPMPGSLRRVGQPVLFDFHRPRILATLDRLPEAAREPSPKFVFAHLMYVHTPFVLDADGHSIIPEGHYTWWPTLSADGGEFRKAYREQVAYLNTKL